MGDVINLRMRKKALAKTAKDLASAQNRIDFGQTKLEKQNGLRVNKLALHRHSAHKRDVTENANLNTGEDHER